MKQWKILIGLVFLLGIIFFYDRLLGMALEPFLEKKLAAAFDMPISITGLRVRLWPCHVTVGKFVIYNPPDFRRPDHFSAQGIDIDLDSAMLKNKFVHITKAHFKEVVFAIESYMAPKGSRTNVKLWYYYMGLDKDTPPPLVPHPKPPPDNTGEKTWRVRVERVELDKGTVEINDRRTPDERHWIFHDLKGYWNGVDFISDYSSPVFTETIMLEGFFGDHPPASFRGEGKCQFADGDNFDLNVDIRGGGLTEYDFLLDGLPGEVRGGTFDLKSKMYCVHSNLDSVHKLTLQSLKLANPNPAQVILKYPFDAVLLVLQKQKTVELDIKVKGYIGDPKFGFFGAFTKATQKALVDKTVVPLGGLTKETLKIAAQTPAQLKVRLDQIGTILTDPFAPKDKETEPVTGENKNV